MDILNEYIDEKTGNLTVIQFRNALKKTGVSLSSSDIGKLVLRLDPA
jgi:hypothetical protein